jgi:voltage-gated potassium channel
MDQGEPTTRVRGRKRDSIFQLFIAALTVFSLLMVAAYYLLPLTQPTKEALLWIDVPISLIFLGDSVRSLRRAPNKAAYLKWGWLDFLGSVPFFLPCRIARLARLIRAWRTLRLHHLRQVGQDLDENRAQSAALITVLLAIVVLTTATVAVLEFESEVPGANIRSGGDAFWWAIVTLATVGYGDYYPVTIWGRIAALALMTVGVGIFGVLASYLANLFLPDDRDDGAPDLAQIAAQLAAVNQRLDAIEAKFGAGAANRAPDAGTASLGIGPSEADPD